MFSEIRSDLVTDAPRCALASPSLVWASVGSVNDVICKVRCKVWASVGSVNDVTCKVISQSQWRLCIIQYSALWGGEKMRVFTDFEEE